MKTIQKKRSLELHDRIAVKGDMFEYINDKK